ncbi:peptidase inhibitor family I36 protein [Streptomyces sp. WELS2]|uniref:peptidase inhibitor family I36 protein n=1 Tax=Streptomyces sp. WELS2 TaxID=2749435 RepID=UPI0015F0FABE|nr:peptidase inhibitor family I36 protein [Streptomyces sp. WELS2]
MRPTVETAVSAAAIASTAVLAVPGTASADTRPDSAVSRCSEGKVCLFDGHNLTGDALQLDPVTTSFIGWERNDRAGSVWNRSGDYVCIRLGAGHYGYPFDIPPGATQELLLRQRGVLPLGQRPRRPSRRSAEPAVRLSSEEGRRDSAERRTVRARRPPYAGSPGP